MLTFILVGLAGCVQPENTADHFKNGYVLCLPGVENHAWTLAGVARGLRDAGIERAIEINQWGNQPFGAFYNLRHYDENRRKAARLAETLVQYRREHADAPITLVGYSGGGGMAIFVAEALPVEVALDRIILLAPAISPGYDLSIALRRTRRGIVNYYSQMDFFMLGWGTKTFGTMDRVYGNSAGRYGFADRDCTFLQDERVTQVDWQSSWLKLLNDGSHDGWLSYEWSRRILAPQLDSALAQPVSR